MRPLRCLLILIAASALVTCSGSKSVTPDDEPETVPDYFFAEWDSVLNVDQVVDDSPDGKHRVTINRRCDYETWLIDRAERIYPARHVLEKSVYLGELPPEIDSLPDTASIWWNNNNSETGVHQPFALTAGTVQYYWDLSKAFREGDYSGTGGLEARGSLLEYTTSCRPLHTFVTPDTTYWYVYVVELELYFARTISVLHPGQFRYTQAYRTVVFDRDQNLLAIIGDGEAVNGGDL